MRLLGLALACSSAGAQDFSQIAIEKVGGGYRYLEGPVWAKDGYLLFSDSPSGRIIRLTPGEGGGPSVFRPQAGGPMGNTFDAQGRFYSCESKARKVTRTDKKGVIETIAEKWEGKRLNGPNDIVVRKDGHVYFTDPAFGAASDTRDLDFHGVYHIPPKGPMELIAKFKSRPNGIAISPNGKALYVSNSDERNVRAFDIDKSGAASGERVFVKDIDGVPDGIRFDEKGNLYVACKGVAIYSPDAKLLYFMETSEPASNMAFGDGDMQGLYITARTSLYHVRLTVRGAVQY